VQLKLLIAQPRSILYTCLCAFSVSLHTARRRSEHTARNAETFHMHANSIICKVKKTEYSSSQTCLAAMGIRVPYWITQCYVTCHPAEVTFPPLPHQPIKADTRFNEPEGMQRVGLVTYRGGIPARRRSPIPVLTGLNVEYRNFVRTTKDATAKPPTNSD